MQKVRSFWTGPILFLGSALVASCPSLAFAQEFPTRAIRIVVPFAAGSAVDTVARIVAHDIAPRLKVPVVVENQAGATGAIGSEAVAKAPADGYTLLLGTTGTHATNPSIYPKLGYSPIRDFSPVGMLVSLPMLVVASPDAPFKSLPELVRYARANPGKLSFATTTAPGIVIGESIKARGKLDIVYVPYRSSLGAINDVIGGQIPLMVTDAVVGTPQIKAGKLRGIAATSAGPTSLLPDVPAIGATFPGLEVVTWFALFAPANTPSAAIERLSAALRQFQNDPAARDRLLQLGFEIPDIPTAEFPAFLRKEIDRWEQWVKEFGIGPQ